MSDWTLQCPDCDRLCDTTEEEVCNCGWEISQYDL